MSRQSTLLYGGGKYYEGLRWYGGRWYASDALKGMVFTIDESGEREDLASFEGLCSGLGQLPDGSILAVSMLDRTLQRITADGHVSQYADLSEVCSSWANDMIVDAKGRAWVGQIGFAIHEGAAPEPTTILRVDIDGSVHVAADGLWCPNGIVVTADGNTLIIAESFAARLTAFTITASGELTDRRVFAQFGTPPEPGPAEQMLSSLEVAPDGLAIDSEDFIWAADAANRRCIRISPAGEIVDEARHPDSANLYSCALGGSDGRTLLLAASEGFFEALAGVDGTAELLTTSVDVPA